MRCSRKIERVVIVGGDFNAVVGKRAQRDCNRIVGDYGHGNRNDRGQSLVDWATSEQLGKLTKSVALRTGIFHSLCTSQPPESPILLSTYFLVEVWLST